MANVNTTSAPVTLPQFKLPALDGSKYVADATGSTEKAASVNSVVDQIGDRFAFQPGQTPAEIMQALQQQFPGANLPSATDVTMGSLDQILSQEGSYIGNARRRGLEQAGQRGLLNSSIAAGASQRAATEAAQPILNQAMQLNNQREAQAFQERMNSINNAVGLTEQERAAAIQQARDQFGAAIDMQNNRDSRAFQGQQAALDRTQGVNNALLGATLEERRALLGSQLGREEAILDSQLRGKLQSDAVAQQDWLASQAYTREFNGQLAMMPVQSAFQLNNMISQYAAENPEVYTPEVISGMTNFLSRNMLSMLQQYFPSMVGNSSAAGGN